MNVFEPLITGIEWITNRQVSRWKKLILPIIIFISLCGIDAVTGFSTFYFSNRKAETVRNLQIALNDKQLDSVSKTQLRKEIARVSKARNINDKVYHFLLRNSSIVEYNKATKQKDIIISYNVFYLVLTSTCFFLLGNLNSILSKFRKTYRENLGGAITKLIIDTTINGLYCFLLFVAINALPIIPFAESVIISKYASNMLYQMMIIASLFGIIMLFIRRRN